MTPFDVARHVKLPTCCSVTESMVSTEFRLPILAVVMPAISLTGRKLYSHRNSIGKSPDVTKHWTLAESPKFDAVGPKSNSAIRGGTRIPFGNHKDVENFGSNNYSKELECFDMGNGFK